jgi:hypothetical protein
MAHVLFYTSAYSAEWAMDLLESINWDTGCKGPRPLEQCHVRSVEVCVSTSVAAAASRDVQLQTWYRNHTPHPSYYSLLLPLYVLHRPLSTQE